MAAGVDADTRSTDICRRSGKLDRFPSDTPERNVPLRQPGRARSFVPRLRSCGPGRRVEHTTSRVRSAVIDEIKLAASAYEPVNSC